MSSFGSWLVFLSCALAANLPTFTYSLSSLNSNIGISAIPEDAAGNTYITGTTFAGGITTTPGAFRRSDYAHAGQHPSTRPTIRESRK